MEEKKKNDLKLPPKPDDKFGIKEQLAQSYSPAEIQEKIFMLRTFPN